MLGKVNSYITNAVPHYIHVSLAQRSWEEEWTTNLQLSNQPPIINNNINPVDDNLHQELHLKHPKEQDAEEHRHTIITTNRQPSATYDDPCLQASQN